MKSLLYPILLLVLFVGCERGSTSGDYFAEGSEFYYNGDYSNAIKSYTQSIEFSDDVYYYALVMRAKAKVKDKDTVGAFLDYQLAKIDFPDSTLVGNIMFDFSYRYAYSDNNLRHLDSLITLDTNLKEALFYKTRICLNKHKNEEALNAINKAIELDADCIEFYKLRCEANFSLNNIEAYNNDLIKIVEAKSDKKFVYSMDNIYMHGKVKDLESDSGIFYAFVDIEILIKDKWMTFERIKTEENGDYEIYLTLDDQYKINFSHRKYVSKHLLIDTGNIPFELKKGGFELHVDMNLFTDQNGFDKSIMDNPIAKGSFNTTDSVFVWDMVYTRMMQERIEKSLNN